MRSKNECCLAGSCILTILLGAILLVNAIKYSEYKDGIIEDTCNITSVSYPKMGSEDNFYSCSCGKRCKSKSEICNKVFMDDELVYNKYISHIESDENYCSYYANTKCVTDFNTLYDIVENNIIEMENMINTSITCYKKDSIYFIDDDTKSLLRTITGLIICISISFVITLCNCLIYFT